MKICTAQTRPIACDIPKNIENHQKLIKMAVANGADLIIFPELSITGYEPTLAKSLATHPDDSSLDNFQKMSDANQITIGVGMPTKSNADIYISMILFQPHQSRQMYLKQYLHADEEPFFVSGPSSSGLIGDNNNIALAICYEISIPEHSEKAFKNGASIYIASVAKSASGVEKAIETLADIAEKYKMTVLMVNSVGLCDNFECTGQSSIWNNKGELLGQLNNINEGIIIIDTDTQEIEINMLM